MAKKAYFLSQSHYDCMQINSFHYNFNKNSVSQNKGYTGKSSFVTAPIGADTVSFGDMSDETREYIIKAKKRKQKQQKTKKMQEKKHMKKSIRSKWKNILQQLFSITITSKNPSVRKWQCKCLH